MRWREVNSGGFSIIFPANREDSAAAALAAASALNEALAAFWRFRLPGRTRIVLSDSSDDANGFATFFPYGLVGADLAEPPPDSELAGSGELLDLVLAHELTHVYTMNAGSPLFRAARRLFGSHPVLYPAVQLPPWAIEGLAVEGESRLTGDGRLNHPPYRLMLAAARGDGRFPSWNGLAGMPAAWPGANGKYLFGAGFMEFLAKKFGGEGLRRYVERASSRLVAFSAGRDFEKAFGEPLGALWEEYRAAIPAPDLPKPEPLSRSGFFQQYPRFLGEDRLLLYRRDYRSRGEVVMLDLQSGRVKPLLRMDAVNSLGLSADGKKILLSAIDNYHAFRAFADIYEFDLQTRRLRRLSRGQRLSQPAASGNAAVIYCVQRRENRYHLAAFDPVTGRARTLSRPFVGLAQPAASPDGNLIAAAVKAEGRPWSIALFSKELDRSPGRRPQPAALAERPRAPLHRLGKGDLPPGRGLARRQQRRHLPGPAAGGAAAVRSRRQRPAGLLHILQRPRPGDRLPGPGERRVSPLGNFRGIGNPRGLPRDRCAAAAPVPPLSSLARPAAALVVPCPARWRRRAAGGPHDQRPGRAGYPQLQRGGLLRPRQPQGQHPLPVRLRRTVPHPVVLLQRQRRILPGS
jgi:hypothetical protein